MSKKYIVLIGACIGVLLLGASIWMLLSWKLSSTPQPNKKSTPRIVVLSDVCKADTIQKASESISNYDIPGVRAVAETILTQPNYQGDVNCDYIVARYYLMTGQVQQARDAIDTLEATMTAGGTYSTVFDPPALRAGDLRPSLEILHEQQQMSQPEQDDLDAVDKL